MNKLTLSSYIQVIKNNCISTPTDEELLNLLFGCVIKPMHLTNNKGEELYYEKNKVSEFINGIKNIPKKIREGSYNVAVVEYAGQYFYDEILFYLPEVNNRLIKELSDIITNDDTIALKDKENFLNKAANENISEFLSSIFLYSLTVDNRKEIKKEHIIKKSVTSNISDELPYVTALYQVYGEKEHKPISSIEMCPKYKNHFSRQQKAYFDAEAVQRSSRDSYKSEEPFDELKAEMYDGIIEAYDSDYCCGYDRLQGVLNQASQVQFDVSVLCHETEWISQSVKKGICHHLVNDDRIKSWVITDE